MTKPTYLKMMADGRYEFGVIQYGVDRRKDRLVKVGEVETYAQAVSQIGDLSSQAA